ncbi:MAG TPA: hypothetical protein VHG91_01650 [Longimicrobium sp.]|nr:hypothetical protein [Longimicrobium sp.]
MRRPRPPIGFVLLAFSLVCIAAVLLMALMATAPMEAPRPLALVGRFLMACNLALAGVTAVALYRVERWAWRAFGGWALSLVLLFAAGLPALGHILFEEWLLVVVVFATGPGTALFLVRAYVRRRLGTTLARPAQRRIP